MDFSESFIREIIKHKGFHHFAVSLHNVCAFGDVFSEGVNSGINEEQLQRLFDILESLRSLAKEIDWGGF